MRCIDCVWYNEGECIKQRIPIYLPKKNRVCPYYNKIPYLAQRYLDNLSKCTEISKEKIVRSKTFKNLLYKLYDVDLNCVD